MAEVNALDGLEPRSIPFRFAGKDLIVRELPLAQRKRVLGLLCSAAIKIAGVIEQTGRDGILQILAAREVEKIVSTIVNIIPGAEEEFNLLTFAILANVENCKAFGFVAEDALYGTPEAEEKIGEICQSQMTTRIQVAVLRAYVEVDGIGELLGNLKTLPDRVEMMTGSDESETD